MNEAVLEVLASGRYIGGSPIETFEQQFAAYIGTTDCVSCNSGTDALYLALRTLGIGAGDEVITSPFTFFATAEMISAVGATPVFVDIEPQTFNLDLEKLEAAMTERTKAVIPVHLFGQPLNMARLMQIAQAHQLWVIEDCAQATGATWNGQTVGSIGHLGCFSFYPTKNMHSLEGGMVTTGDPELARTLRLLRNQGMEQRYANEIVGANMRMTDVAAAIGRVQLRQLADWTEQRRANAKFLDSKITGMVTPPVADNARHVYHQYTVRVQGDRDAAQARLTELGIGNAVYYPTPIHRLKPYLTEDGKPGPWDLPETERAAAEVVSLPVHPSLSEGDLERIAEGANLAGGAR